MTQYVPGEVAVMEEAVEPVDHKIFLLPQPPATNAAVKVELPGGQIVDGAAAIAKFKGVYAHFDCDSPAGGECIEK